MIRRLALALVAVVASCSSERAGWARRGSYWILDETPDLAVRRGAQVADPATGEIALAWVGARAPETSPPLLACELIVFEDRNGNRSPDAGETVAVRENLHVTRKILFDDVRAPARSGNALFARIVARTESGSRVVTWSLVPDAGR